MKTVLITGGTGGIGKALVKGFSAEGWRTAFGYHRKNQEAKLLAEETGSLCLQADLRDEISTLSFFESAMRQLGHLDALIVCAGVSWQGLITDMPTASYDDLMALNLRSAFTLSKQALLLMNPQHKGSILFISSIQGLHGASCEAAYAASKAGLIGLAKSLAREYGPSGIRVNCLAPGVIDTGMMDAFSPEDKEALLCSTPLQRLGSAEDVRNAALFLTSDKASFITGQVLGVDGGLTL